MEYVHQISPDNSEKYGATFNTKITLLIPKSHFWYQNHHMWKKNWRGEWCCGSCQAPLRGSRPFVHPAVLWTVFWRIGKSYKNESCHE